MRGLHLRPSAQGNGDIIARKGFLRRVLEAVEHIFAPRPETPPPPPEPPAPVVPPRYEPRIPQPFTGPPRVDEQGFVVYPSMSPYEKVLHAEGLVDYNVFDTTGVTVVTDQYAADLIYAGWFDADNTADDRVAARQDYYDYTDSEPSDFDWYDWREWYSDTAQAA